MWIQQRLFYGTRGWLSVVMLRCLMMSLCVCVCVCACVCVLNVSQELDAKIASLVIELQKKKQGLETEHTETQMMQVSHGSQGSWVTQFM